VLTGRSPSLALLGYPLLAVFAAGVGVQVAKPLWGPAISFDSQVSVFHFQLLTSGRHIDEFITTTPKPLLTVVYGVLYELGSWRAISLAAIGAYVVGVVLAAALAHRLAGPVAAAFAGVGTAMSATLVYDVGFALGTPWALACWLAAGLAASASKPRYAVAGVFLALATLARLETILVTATMVVALGGAVAYHVLRGGAAPPRHAWIGVGVAACAVPVMAIHDLLVAGDPLYWTRVASVYSAHTSLPILSPTDVLRLIVNHWARFGGLVLLAVGGAAWLTIERRRSILLAALALGPLALFALVGLAVRGIFVESRYLAAPELTTILLAAVGLGRIAKTLQLATVEGRPIGPRTAGTVGASVAVCAAAVGTAIVLVQPFWVQRPNLLATVQQNGQLAAHLERAVPVMAAALRLGRAATPPGVAKVIVPRQVPFRAIVDLGLQQRDVDSQRINAFDIGSRFPVAGQIVMHDEFEMPIPPASDLLKIRTPEPTVVDGVLVEPLLADGAAGLWVVELVASGASAAR
jgi:hypothetical protein